MTITATNRDNNGRMVDNDGHRHFRFFVCTYRIVFVIVCGRRCCGRHCHGLWLSLSILWPSLSKPAVPTICAPVVCLAAIRWWLRTVLLNMWTWSPMVKVWRAAWRRKYSTKSDDLTDWFPAVKTRTPYYHCRIENFVVKCVRHI